jgi:hypothetical protein
VFSGAFGESKRQIDRIDNGVWDFYPLFDIGQECRFRRLDSITVEQFVRE